MRTVVRLTAVLGAATLVATFGMPASWAASAWTASIAPTAPHRTPAALADIACPSATLCVGVYRGRPQALVIAGGVAGAQALPLPIDAGSPWRARLAAIACPSTTSCVAVGGYETYTRRSRPLFETYTAGKWRASTIETAAQGLSDVACNAATCIATGDSYGDPFYATAMLERDASGTWTDSGLDVEYGNSVAEPTCAPGTGPCFAQVYAQVNAIPADRMLAYQSGSTWKTMTFPGLSGADMTTLQLGTMACPSSSYCVAAGSYFDAAAPHAQHLIAETYTHRTLSSTELPMPAGFADESDPFVPSNTACSGTGRCVAGGYFRYRATYRGHDGLVFAKSGTTWTVQPIPVPSGQRASSAWATATDCVPGGLVCAAVGKADASSALAEVYAGGSWSPTTIAPPSGHTADQLTSVACAAGSCTAVGATGGDPLLATHR